MRRVASTVPNRQAACGQNVALAQLSWPALRETRSDNGLIVSVEAGTMGGAENDVHP
jgi:hypothetical protein